jgi:hypothetical protein
MVTEVIVSAGNGCITWFWRNGNWWWVLVPIFFLFWFDVCWLHRKRRVKNPAGYFRTATMLTIFFRSRRFLVLEPLPKSTKFNQDYFIDAIFPGLHNERRRISRKEGFPAFSVHLDNSMCHNGNKISEKLAKRSIEWAPEPPYSPDISPCDFSLFGMLKRKMKDREFHSQQTILSAVATMWNDLTFTASRASSRNGWSA